MTPDRFPEEVADDYPEPPIAFTDREDREIEVRAYDGSERERDALAAMYEAFDSADRAQGIPPGHADEIRKWLSTILDADCYNVLAWHGDDVAGHATLVPAGDDADEYELAIFVLQKYQEAGIGTRLIEALLGYGQADGVEAVWLTVERWNHAAVSLYEKIGFETSDAESFEIGMSLRLNRPERTADADEADE
ncbi:GNAT family N-acetyltransferase [Halopenitus persicus]|uniref:Acetyltransferase (GNAT) family protein n=1 Tax=Halopenitus persicus TaxID=1048396 RepID=A0A1H3FWI3_9EURY|nr:GNAT family N-acetyltransferase [Halopenitus persicus]QHS16808.1 GNAT family N-acetyltransferase [haloarchaeon 3A1-DGR]SDX95157.1 Acetyltransferase (GNAT) family protein [Halopenitus persicus]